MTDTWRDTKKLPAKFRDPKFQQAIYWFDRAVKTDKKYQKLADQALTKYGDHGALISGVLREHFPIDIKNKLRKLAHSKSEMIDKGFLSKPPRVHDKTMRELYQAIKNMAKKNPIGKTATSIQTRNGWIAVKYHDTNVVSYNPNSRVVVLNSGGWLTPTTKRRMNEASDEYGLGFKVYSKAKQWYIDTPYDGTIKFHDGVRFQGKRASNPKGKRKVAKKKRRTAAQRAATRKLVALNKRRAKARRKTTRTKTRRKKNVTRRGAPRRVAKRGTKSRSHLFVVFKCKGNMVSFLRMNSKGKIDFTTDKGKAALFQTKKDAAFAARGAKVLRDWDLGVANAGMTIPEIRASCVRQSKGK